MTKSDTWDFPTSDMFETKEDLTPISRNTLAHWKETRAPQKG